MTQLPYGTDSILISVFTTGLVIFTEPKLPAAKAGER